MAGSLLPPFILARYSKVETVRLLRYIPFYIKYTLSWEVSKQVLDKYLQCFCFLLIYHNVSILLAHVVLLPSSLQSDICLSLKNCLRNHN